MFFSIICKVKVLNLEVMNRILRDGLKANSFLCLLD